MMSENEVTFPAVKAELRFVLTLADGRTVEIEVPEVIFADSEGFTFTHAVEYDEEITPQRTIAIKSLEQHHLKVMIEGRLLHQEDGDLFTFRIDEE